MGERGICCGEDGIEGEVQEKRGIDWGRGRREGEGATRGDWEEGIEGKGVSRWGIREMGLVRVAEGCDGLYSFAAAMSSNFRI